MRKGFTLVELSIVLVIIGLLIGGILAAQSMINTARIQALVRDMQQYNIAAVNFKTSYNKIPGDANNFSPIGDNDGLVKDSTNTSNHFSGEIANFWPQLQQGGFNYKGRAFTATFPATGLDITSLTPNTPSVMGDKKAGIIVAYNNPNNYFNLADWGTSDFSDSGAWTITQGTGFLTPANAYAVDLKIDDGAGGSGKILGTILITTIFSCVTIGPHNYVLTTTTPACPLSMELDK